MSDESVGARIRRPRKQYGLSLRELAVRSDMARSYLSDIENDRHDTNNTSVGMAARIAVALGVPIGVLLGDELTACGHPLIVHHAGQGSCHVCGKAMTITISEVTE